MGDQRHTEGLWFVVPYGDGDSLVIHSNAANRVCFMPVTSLGPASMKTIRANADLISASPDLLEALKEIVEFVAITTDNNGNRVSEICQISDFEFARAAIAKAEGKQS
jgi:hypothetical protein